MTTHSNELTISEACRRLNAAGVACTTSTVRAWLDAGTLRGRTAPRPSGRRFIRIDASSVEEIITTTTDFGEA